MADGRKFREEYQLYKQNQEVISKNFIRTYIKDKIESNKALLGKLPKIISDSDLELILACLGLKANF